MEMMPVTFEPNAAQDLLNVWLGIGVMVASLIGAYFLLRKRHGQVDYNRYMLGAMLLFFVGLIAAATAFFSWWNQYKTGPVVIDETSITTPYGVVDFKDIKNASIESTGRPSLIDPSRVRNQTKVLIIEEVSGNKVHLLSEQHYDVQAIMQALREAVNAEEK